jgi:CTP:molybdopterin cytidylyltransferase MocA
VQLPLNPNNRQTNDKCHLVFSASSQYDIAAATVMMVDQPNTTSQVTYKIFARAEQSGYIGIINCSLNGATGALARSWIYAVEF